MLFIRKEERETLGMVNKGRSPEKAFNRHYLETLRDLHNLFLTTDLSLEAIRRFREDKQNIMEACENCLCDSSEPKENVFAVDVANEVEDYGMHNLVPNVL